MKIKQQPPPAGRQTVAVNKPRRLLFVGWFYFCGLVLSNSITVPAATILAATATTPPSEVATVNTQPHSNAILQSVESIADSNQLAATPMTTDPVPITSVTATAADLDEQAQVGQDDNGATESTAVPATETSTPATPEIDQISPAAGQISKAGTFGTVAWRLEDQAGTLVLVLGAGELGEIAFDYNNTNPSERSQLPWLSSQTAIQKVVFEGPVTAHATADSTGTFRSLAGLFDNMKSLTVLENISHLQTTQVNDLSYLFNDCASLPAIDLTHFETSAATDFSQMFSGCSRLTSLDVSPLDTSAATYMPGMFAGTKTLTEIVGLDKLKTARVTNFSAMFEGCFNLTELDITQFDFGQAAAIYSMFTNCTELTTLDLSAFDTLSNTPTQPYSLDQMFSGCLSLTTLDLQPFVDKPLGYLSYTFSDCASLTTLDLSMLKTAAVTSFESTFANCTSLKSINLTGLDTSSATTMATMFLNTNSLHRLNLSHFQTENLTTAMGMFASLDLGTGEPTGPSQLEDLDISGLTTTQLDDDGLDMMLTGLINLKKLKLGAATKLTRAVDLPESSGREGKWQQIDDDAAVFANVDLMDLYNDPPRAATYVPWGQVPDEGDGSETPGGGGSENPDDGDDENNNGEKPDDGDDGDTIAPEPDDDQDTENDPGDDGTDQDNQADSGDDTVDPERPVLPATGAESGVRDRLPQTAETSNRRAQQLGMLLLSGVLLGLGVMVLPRRNHRSTRPH
ncbi:BspA family leucine-rich repeat surface protein [Lapidilactobacillus achengensis]|uniref:BspA family leucine-rich repeat surface protein n=1 Tax=Lapidilactobacillus achengensis TaxID=2486000 RepID=A0ABW1UPR6_9LACO|nr:BspA family leucine-rich repeat surface protein [Lapidilactobacillus achengensis]